MRIGEFIENVSAGVIKPPKNIVGGAGKVMAEATGIYATASKIDNAFSPAIDVISNGIGEIILPITHRLRRTMVDNHQIGNSNPRTFFGLSAAAAVDVITTIPVVAGGAIIGGPLGAGLAFAALRLATHGIIDTGIASESNMRNKRNTRRQ